MMNFTPVCFLAARGEAFKTEKADCSVRALSKCLGIEYAAAHRALKEAGRKNRCRVAFRKVAAALGFEPSPEYSCRTIESVLPEMVQGRYFVYVSGHFFAVVNGVIYDAKPPKPGTRIKMVYEPTCEVEKILEKSVDGNQEL